MSTNLYYFQRTFSDVKHDPPAKHYGSAKRMEIIYVRNGSLLKLRPSLGHLAKLIIKPDYIR